MYEVEYTCSPCDKWYRAGTFGTEDELSDHYRRNKVGWDGGYFRAFKIYRKSLSIKSVDTVVIEEKENN